MRIRTQLLKRKHLIEDSLCKNIDDLSSIDFISHIRNIFKSENLIIFIDDNGDTRIMKNRFGKEGTIRGNETG